MNLLTGESPAALWQSVVRTAEEQCSITLNEELESYLVTLLIRYSNKPEVAQQVFALKFLEALQHGQQIRQTSLQHLGDHCLLYAGLYPRVAETKHVSISYFVDLGRSAYANVAKNPKDVYWSLALEFVTIMDVLQSIRQYPDLLPLEAYEQWISVGSQHALQILQMYSRHPKDK